MDYERVNSIEETGIRRRNMEAIKVLKECSK